MSEMNKRIVEIVKNSLNEVFSLNVEDSFVMVEIPKDNSHGDYATNVAMKLAKELHKAPREIAESLKSSLMNNEIVASIEIAGPGFINFFLKKDSITEVIKKILNAKENYGRNNFGNKKKVMVEYVSANPTGDLHLGHARGAAYGDTLTRVLSYCGYDVLREYYVNDAGHQIAVLGESLYERYKQALGLEFDLEKIGYQGKDVIKLAEKIAKKDGKKWVNDDSEARFDYFRQIGTDLELDKIKNDLKLYRMEFDHFQSELELYRSGKVANTLEELKKSKYTYESEGALWLKTTEFGDDKDRVLVKSDGSLTYFTPDIAYHKDKFDRGYQHLINLFGADHHGYIARLKAAMKILGYDPEELEIKIVQMVRLMANGEEMKMSKRTGNAITIRELCEDVGVDVARYFYISKPIISQLDFDLDLARKQSNENPVYYIQYAYARINSILNKQNDYEIKDSYSLLKEDKEIAILKHLGEFEGVLVDICKVKEVNILCNYAYKLAQLFHSFYNDFKVIDVDQPDLTKERLALVKATGTVLKNVLNLLGIEAKDSM
ncbi:MAG: arginine--tRNA ligase [Bacilli bacterium]|nr:arginine--tRNA ligase [Bacilli bacterium]